LADNRRPSPQHIVKLQHGLFQLTPVSLAHDHPRMILLYEVIGTSVVVAVRVPDDET
jgi:hypothetical protein